MTALKHFSKYYDCFAHYTNEELNTRIDYWEHALPAESWGVLELMYMERDHRVDNELLAWVERK